MVSLLAAGLIGTQLTATEICEKTGRFIKRKNIIVSCFIIVVSIKLKSTTFITFPNDG